MTVRSSRMPGLLAILVLAFSMVIVMFPREALAASYTVKLSGTVICSSSSQRVVGIWVENYNGQDKFADWYRIPGYSNAAKFSVSFTASRVDPKIRLDVGCGGTTSNWGKNLRTADFRVKTGYVSNWKCNTGAKTGTVACSSPPKGTTATYNQGFAGYCTWGAYDKWKSYIGWYPKIGGDAWKMDDNAKTNGWFVTRVPHAAAMIVFDKGYYPGHVGWVTSFTKNSSGQIVITYIDMNGGTGGSNANDWQTNAFNKFVKRTVVWDSKIHWFIVAPRKAA